eukprot:9349822-Ditylum_brightwellii.AAC.1
MAANEMKNMTVMCLSYCTDERLVACGEVDLSMHTKRGAEFEDLKERGITKGDVNSGTALILPPPMAEELLGTSCTACGMLAAVSGVPDYQHASCIIIKEYVDGKLLFCHQPPNPTT